MIVRRESAAATPAPRCTRGGPAAARGGGGGGGGGGIGTPLPLLREVAFIRDAVVAEEVLRLDCANRLSSASAAMRARNTAVKRTPVTGS